MGGAVLFLFPTILFFVEIMQLVTLNYLSKGSTIKTVNTIFFRLKIRSVAMVEIIVGLIGAITGIIGVIISLFSFSHNRIEAVNAFYSNDRDSRFIEARRIVHTLPEKYEPSDIQKQYGDHLSVLILSFDQAGILVKKHQLPFWVFSRGGCGVAVVNFYRKLVPYIRYKRKENPLYASNFEYLKNKIIVKGKLRNFLTLD